MKTIKIFAQIGAIISLLLILFLASCINKPSGIYEVTYVVFYPEHSDTTTVELSSDGPWSSRCNRGDNYMWARNGGYYLSTSAPIKIISQKKVN